MPCSPSLLVCKLNPPLVSLLRHSLYFGSSVTAYPITLIYLYISQMLRTKHPSLPHSKIFNRAVSGIKRPGRGQVVFHFQHDGREKNWQGGCKGGRPSQGTTDPLHGHVMARPRPPDNQSSQIESSRVEQKFQVPYLSLPHSLPTNSCACLPGSMPNAIPLIPPAAHKARRGGVRTRRQKSCSRLPLCHATNRRAHRAESQTLHVGRSAAAAVVPTVVQRPGRWWWWCLMLCTFLHLLLGRER